MRVSFRCERNGGFDVPNTSTQILQNHKISIHHCTATKKNCVSAMQEFQDLTWCMKHCSRLSSNDKHSLNASVPKKFPIMRAACRKTNAKQRD